MALFHPTREGTRGGRDQFKWDDVKQDHYRENYLGHSLLAPVGRWQKNRDLTWYAKDESAKATQTRAQLEADELRKFKEAEAEAVAEALGYKGPKKHLDPTKVANVSKVELDKLVKAEVEADPLDNELEKQKDAQKVKGIGYGRLRNLDVNLGRQVVEHVPGREPAPGEEPTASEYVPIASSGAGVGARKEQGSGAESGSDSETPSERKRRKKEKKERKREKKERKRKEKEREREQDGRRERERSRSRDDGHQRRRERSRSRDNSRNAPPPRRRMDSPLDDERRRDVRRQEHSRRDDSRERTRDRSPRRDGPPPRRRHDSPSDDERDGKRRRMDSRERPRDLSRDRDRGRPQPRVYSPGRRW